jgi:hypothetical protein
MQVVAAAQVALELQMGPQNPCGEPAVSKMQPAAPAGPQSAEVEQG